MKTVVNLIKEPIDTEAALLTEMRRCFNIGTAAEPSINRDFSTLYRRLIGLTADNNNGTDPSKLKAENLREAQVIYDFLRDLKRAVLQITRNMSIYGTNDPYFVRLVDKWGAVMTDSIWILGQLRSHVGGEDSDEKWPWSVAAALTGTPRETVTAYVVNALDGGHLLRLAVETYDAVQAGNAGSEGLDGEGDDFLQALFFTKAKELLKPPIEPAMLQRIEDMSVSAAFKQPGTRLKDEVATLWP